MAKPRAPKNYDHPYASAEDLGMKAHVLVELDGPRVVLFRSPRGDRLGIVVEPGLDPEQWILATVTKMELEALARGAVPVRDIFSQRVKLRRLDLDHKWRPLRGFDVGPSEIPDDVLPVLGALLPDTSRPALSRLLRLRADKQIRRRVRFDGAAVRENRISFAALAQLTQSLQNLWASIAEAFGIAQSPGVDGLPAELIADSTGRPRSFVLNVHVSNEPAFDKLLIAYRRILRGAFDADASILAEVTSHQQLSKTLDVYLKTLETWGAETFIESPTDLAYVGSASAPSIRSVIKSTSVTERLPRDQVATTRLVQGYFSSFDIDECGYAFNDIQAGETVSGKIAGALMKKLREGGKEATVGTRSRYTATLEERFGKPVLLDFSKTQGELV